jgi:hypothetical protein
MKDEMWGKGTSYDFDPAPRGGSLAKEVSITLVTVVIHSSLVWKNHKLMHGMA